MGPQDWRLRARDGGHSTLTGRNSGHRLDVANGSAVPGTNVRQWYCNGSSAQDWRLENVGRGYYRLIAPLQRPVPGRGGGFAGTWRQRAAVDVNGLQPQIWRLQRA